MICSRCRSAAGALVRIEGDPQGRQCFVCSVCGSVTSPVPCMCGRFESAAHDWTLLANEDRQ